MRLGFLLTALLMFMTPPQAAAQTDLAERFAPYSETGPRIDYSAWSELLGDIVLGMPPSSRMPQRRRDILTGTRINTGNQTRYRYEANRVILHLIQDDYADAIREYRRELEALPDQVPLAALTRDEQLAYWLNLHNAAVIEQMLENYPRNNVERFRGPSRDGSLFEERFLTVEGVPLSLNDIRLRIVYANWDDPRVIYGFFNGSIGGPNIAREAYDRSNLWRQLTNNGQEFVNSLRGVEIPRSRLRVSHIYGEAAKFFPNFEPDLRAHIRVYAEQNVLDALAEPVPLEADVETWLIADLINGSRRCRGGIGDPNIQTSGTWISPDISCSIIPQNARVLLDYRFERYRQLFLEGRYGTVRTVDIPTDENGNPMRLQPYEAEEENRPE